MIPLPIALVTGLLLVIATWQFAVFCTRLWIVQRLHSMADCSVWAVKISEAARVALHALGAEPTEELVLSSVVHACAELIWTKRLPGDDALEKTVPYLTNEETDAIVRRVRKDP